MANSNIYKKNKAIIDIKTVKIKIRGFLSLFNLFLLIFFISIGLIFYFNSQKKLYGEENTGSHYYETSVKNTTKTPFILPVDGEIALGFREDYIYNEKNITRKHTGIDIKGEFSQDVFSSGNGIVSYIGFSPTGGRTIVIRHNEKIRTTYLNLLNIFVFSGDKICQGDIIGTIGGNDDPSSSVGNHLHFGVIYNGFYLDPEDVLKISYINITSYISLEYMENDFKLE